MSYLRAHKHTYLCDHDDCYGSESVESVTPQPSDLSIERLRDKGWTIDGTDNDGAHYCPEHESED